MLDKVKKAISNYNMISMGETVLCCLSGGADSVALLLCLHNLGYNVKACHVNHQLRGDESLRDEKFCIDLCNKMSIDIDVRRIDVKKYCSDNAVSIEEGARNLRYEIFSSCGCDKIATAHTLSDALETSLFNIARGTGLKGLCGIPPVRDQIIRPIIYCTRRQVEDFLEENNQGYVIDSSNLTDDYSRNKIRNKVVPVLAEINSSVENNFGRTLNSLRTDLSFISDFTDKILKSARLGEGIYSCEIISAQDYAIKSRVVIKILGDSSVDYSMDRVDEILEIIENGGKINVSKDKYAICSQGIFRICEFKNDLNKNIVIKIEINEIYIIFKKKVSFSVYKKTDEFVNVNKKLTKTFVDYDKIRGEILLRNRQNGDLIKFADKNHTTKIKKLFNEKVLVENRDEIFMLADDDGLIFVEGFGVADRVKVDVSTKNILVCTIS